MSCDGSCVERSDRPSAADSPPAGPDENRRIHAQVLGPPPLGPPPPRPQLPRGYPFASAGILDNQAAWALPTPLLPDAFRLQPSWLPHGGIQHGRQFARRHHSTSSTQRRRLQGPIGTRPALSQEGGEPRHIGVTCDGCHAIDFVGIRYRCTHCRDFDFCDSCHARRSDLHPSHVFEAIRTPRPPMQSLLADFMNQAANRTVVAIIEIGLEGHESLEARSGLEDSLVSWWLADDTRLIPVDRVAVEEPSWCCPICSEGLEAEGSNGWLVEICTDREISGKGPQAPSSENRANDGASETPSETTGSAKLGHLYHESCLRRWLLKRNSCPVCRRSPVVTAPAQ